MTERVCEVTDGRVFCSATLEKDLRMSIVDKPESERRVEALESEVKELKKKVQENEDLLMEVAMGIGKGEFRELNERVEYLAKSVNGLISDRNRKLLRALPGCPPYTKVVKEDV